MKRNLFVLVLSLMLLSFGQTFAQDYGTLSFSAAVTAGGWDGNTKINPGAFTITVSATTSGGDGTPRITWSSPFEFTGSGVTVVWGDTALYGAPGFYNNTMWDSYKRTYNESWDGALPDLFNFTGIGNNGGFPGNTTLIVANFNGTISGAGQICVGKGTPVNLTYDWLFDDPQPVFAPVCFTVETAPNFAPSFTAAGADCPVQVSGQWDDPLTETFLAVDVEDDDITYSKAGGVGTVTGGGGWSYDPVCADVGQSLNVDVFAADATHGSLPGEASQHCVMTVVVLNTAPQISGDCGKTIVVGDAGGALDFNATDANTGDVLTFSIANVAPVPVGTYGIDPITGVLTFDPDLSELGTDFVFTVKVTDCAGDFATCTANINTVAALPYVIQIEKVHNALQGHHSYVTVKKMAGSEDMLGFDFLIAYDASALTFMGAVPGVLFNMTGIYQWEYFNYRFGANGNCGNACPSGLLRVVGLAEQNDGPHQALETTVPDNTILFTLDFLVSNNRVLECQYVPIRFFWMDCGDNTIAYHPSTGEPNEVWTGISRYIYEFWTSPLQWGLPDESIDDPYAGFPTFLGAMASCDTKDDTVWAGVPYQSDILNIKPGTVPWIDFVNGGIDIVCADSIDLRGDVNLNGLANEIGDAVVFTNYFIKGLNAFTVNVEGQIAATDINADGIALSVSDLVYLIRVIVGDALPYYKLSPYAVTAEFSFNGSVISTDAVLGAALFTFDGTADVTLASGAAGMELKTGVLDGNTVALVYSFDKGVTANGAIINTNGTVKSIEAVDYNGSAYRVGALPTVFSVNNYPNPFNPVATIKMTIPTASNWTITVYNVAGQKVAGFSGYGQDATVQFDGGALGSGVYFYKAEAGKFSATKKMVLMK